MVIELLLCVLVASHVVHVVRHWNRIPSGPYIARCDGFNYFEVTTSQQEPEKKEDPDDLGYPPCQ